MEILNKYNKNNKEKGVTLVALVVTIIVLLILAFIGISILKGEDGVIQKSKESKEETIKAQEREYIKLSYQNLEMELKINGKDITADRLEAELKKHDENAKVKEIQESEIGDREIVVDRKDGTEYGEVTFEETEHEYVVPLVIDPSKARYTITYNANGGQGGPTKQTKVEGTDLYITTEEPTKAGYSLVGWSENPNDVTAQYFGGSRYSKEESTTLYAIWEETTYSITYNLDGGTVEGNPTAYKTSTTPIKLKNPTKAGYTFDGWTGTGLKEKTIQVTIPTGSAENRTYIANWTDMGFVDSTKPTAGTIIAKEENQDGNNYDLTISPWSAKNIYIEKVDGSDNESGHRTTTYTVEKGPLTVYEDIQDPITLTESGTYKITVTTEDMQGNIATSEPYIIKIDKSIAEITLKHNDVNGEVYDGTWTKDDLYGKIDINTSITGKTFEKYQYSYDGNEWYDISEKPAPANIDYTIDNFGNIQNKPEWIGDLTNNGTYYFEVQEDGTLKPNNSGKNSTTANSYIEIDLTDYPEASLDITVNAAISSENNWDFGYAEITTINTAPTFNKNNSYFIKVSGPTTTKDLTTTLTGGQKYYLHIGYSKDGSGNSNQDTFIINSISFKSETIGKGINFSNYAKTDNKVTFKLTEDIRKEIYVRAVYNSATNETSKYENRTSIKIDKTAPVVESSNYTILNQTDAKATIKVREEGSGIKGYYISTEETAPTESSSWTEQLSSEFTIEELNAGTTYYLWLKDNVGNISEKQEIVIGNANYIVDDSIYMETIEQAIEKASDGSMIKLLNNYTDTSIATFNKNITFDIQNYELIRSTTITINSGKTVEITGTGKITTEENNVNTITNNGTLTVTNSITIENMSASTSYTPIYNNSSSAIININDNVQINGYYKGIYNYDGILNVNGGKIEATYSSSSSYGVYNYNRTTVKLYLNGGEITGYYGVYNGTSSTLEMTGGKVIGIGAYGIYTGGTTNIYGGRIEGKTYGVYSNATDKVTIGKQEDELSTTQPAIYGASYGVYMSATTNGFNFYNGVIISNTKETAHMGTANLRENHMTYTYLDYDVEQKYCTILTPTVENITMEATPTAYTNKNVTVKIIYPYNNDIKQYSEDGTEWKVAEQYVQEVIVTENKIIYARTLKESGIIIEEQQIEVNNIDKENPTVKVSPTETNYTVTEENGTVDITITITATDTGVSGLDKVQYAWVAEGEEITYVDFTNEITISKTKLGIGQYNLYLNVTDKAGNKAELTQMRYNVKFQEPVAQIEETKYLTIQEAIEACSKESGETQTTITIIKSTDEEFTTYEGQNIILDLKGHTIGSSSQDAPICINNGTMQIIDTSTEKIGKLESLNGIAALNNGTITIGDNSTSIESEVPTIYGYKVGINNQGILNFYDGKIQGITPIQGNVTNTPEEYGPVSTDYSNGITTVQLGIVTGYEARIEWVYYTTVQEAINKTKTGDTVTIIKDIQLKEIAEVNVSKNMILDLNSYDLTIVSEKNKVINNYGQLEITDSNVEQTGNITIDQTNICYGIYNASTGTITLSGGTVSCSSNGSYGIYNASTGNVSIKGGTISSSNYGIYNASTGNVLVNEGIINGSYYGIYNASTGTVEVSGGTVNSSSKYTSYGIYNASTGPIILCGGTISCNSSSSYGIYNVSTGMIEITGGTVSSSSSNGSYGIYNVSTGNVSVAAGTVSSSGSSSISYGICNVGIGHIELTGGTVKSSSNGRYSSYNICGIQNTGKGSIIIGAKGDGVSQEKLNIKGEYKGTISSYVGVYGVYNRLGKVEFYNGIIQGDTALLGNITKIRDGYKIEKNTIGDKESIYLVEKINTEYIVQIEETKYYSLQEAIDSIGEEEKTIEVIRNFELEENETIKFNKNIILNLNGYTITNNYYRLENTGNLTIEDLTEEQEGKIENVETLIGILNMEDATIMITGGTVSSSNSSNSYGIYNESMGTIIVSRGTVSSSGSGYSYGIYNANTGSTKVTAGIISSSDYGIYNKSTGMIEITGGTVSSSNNSNTYGIYNASTGSIIIGTKGDGLILQEEPYVKGKYTGTSTIYVGYGISNTKGQLYFYDGKIEGTTKAVYDTITEKEDNTEFNYNEDETILTLTTEVIPIAQIEETTYETLEEAINSVGGEQITIKILRNVVYTATDTVITIPADKDIILDLNGYKITSAIPEKVMQNEGILEITDTSENQTGSIVTSEEKTISNISGAKLIISGGMIENRTKYSVYNEGELTIQGGTVSSNSSSSSYGIYNTSKGNVAVNGGKVSSNGSGIGYSYGIYNASTGNVSVNQGKVSGILDSNTGGYNYGCGIYNASTGNVLVCGGTISSESTYFNSYGIYNKSTGKIIMGTKGDGIISQGDSSITATKTSSSSSYVAYGIYNINGTLKYYDGTLKGSTSGIYGNITEIEDTTEILISSETVESKSYEVLTLQQKETNVASVNNIEYDSIQKAVEVCGTTESTITILRDSDPGATIIIGEDQNITIDLNGYTINNYTELQNKGTLKITDSSEAKTGKMVGLTGIAISNNGNMELIEGDILNSGYGIKNAGALTINGGNITNNIYGIYNDTNGTVTLTIGTISSNTYGLYNYNSSSNININSGTISSNEYGIYNSSGMTNISSTAVDSNTYGIYNAGGTTTINAGTEITNGSYGIYNAEGTTTIKEGAEIQSNTGIYVSSGTLNIGETGTMSSSSPVIIGENYGLSVASDGIVYMYDGQIKGKTGATQGFITYTEEGYQVANKTEGGYNIDYLVLAGTISTVAQVNGIDFSNLQSAINSITGEEAQTITLTNGIVSDITFTIAEGQNIILDMNGKTISSDLDVTINNSGTLTIIDSSGNNVAKISSTIGTAIVNSGTLTLGQDDGTVSQDLITIEGTTYGIENTGTLNFYDGTINGASAVNGTVTNRPDGYVIRTTTVNGKERYYLST